MKNNLYSSCSSALTFIEAEFITACVIDGAIQTVIVTCSVAKHTRQRATFCETNPISCLFSTKRHIKCRRSGTQGS